MPKPEFHVFVCGQARPEGHPRGSCAEKGAGPLMNAFSQSLMAKRLINSVSLVNTGCLGPCQGGANVLVYPGAVLYMNVEPKHVDTIIDQHIVAGEPVADLLAPADIW